MAVALCLGVQSDGGDFESVKKAKLWGVKNRQHAVNLKVTEPTENITGPAYKSDGVVIEKAYGLKINVGWHVHRYWLARGFIFFIKCLRRLYSEKGFGNESAQAH